MGKRPNGKSQLKSMKSKYLLQSLAAAFIIAGCSSTSSQQSAEKPPPKAGRVQILMYDTAPRPITTHLDICGTNAPQRPYKIIALLTCEGAVNQEVVMTAAIYYRARQIGAEAVMDAGTVNEEVDTLNVTQGIAQQAMMSGLGLGSTARCIFRANAIVYTDSQAK